MPAIADLPITAIHTLVARKGGGGSGGGGGGGGGSGGGGSGGGGGGGRGGGGGGGYHGGGDDGEGGNHLSVGEIVAIVVGVIAGITLICTMVYYYKRRAKVEPVEQEEKGLYKEVEEDEDRT